MGESVNVFWFRRDLRLFDNTALYHALNCGKSILPIFIFDTCILNKLPHSSDKRVSFIYQKLNEINEILKEKNSSLYILHGTPLASFQKLTTEYTIENVYANHDYEPYAIERDKQINDYLQQQSISFNTWKDQVIFEKSEVMKADGSPYTVFTPYSKAWKRKYITDKPSSVNSEKYLDNFIKEINHPFPSLAAIGFEDVEMEIPALNIYEDTIKNYNENRNLPSIPGTSMAGIHLRFGTVSNRHIVELANGLNDQWLNELIWREFFMMILFHFPHVVNQSFRKKYDNIRWRNNEKEFELWCKGETGYPIVDAGMRQLNETGWMHNRVRMVVASFLTKHLLIDWRWGEAYFADKLLDYELASNNGNWQWATGSGCDAAPYFRIFNPSEQVRKFDPELKYIKTWIRDYKPGYLEPIVDHDFARKRALDVYKKSLEESTSFT